MLIEMLKVNKLDKFSSSMRLFNRNYDDREDDMKIANRLIEKMEKQDRKIKELEAQINRG